MSFRSIHRASAFQTPSSITDQDPHRIAMRYSLNEYYEGCFRELQVRAEMANQDRPELGPLLSLAFSLAHHRRQLRDFHRHAEQITRDLQAAEEHLDVNMDVLVRALTLMDRQAEFANFPRTPDYVPRNEAQWIGLEEVGRRNLNLTRNYKIIEL